MTNKAIELADWLHHHPTQSNADKAAAMLRSQAAEIERLREVLEYIDSENASEEVLRRVCLALGEEA